MEGMPARAGAKGIEEDRTGGWPIVGLLFLFMLINFADRAVLGLAATPIMQELALSHTQFGLIGASFFTFFSVGALIGGFVVNRVATKWVLAGLALFWSLCQLPILLTVTATALVANRVALGFGEGPAYPIAVHAAYKWFPERAQGPSHKPDRHRRPGRQRDHRPGDRLGHRRLVMANRIRAPRRRGPCLVCRMADHRPGRASGCRPQSGSCRWRTARAFVLPSAVELPDGHRRPDCGLLRLLAVDPGHRLVANPVDSIVRLHRDPGRLDHDADLSLSDHDPPDCLKLFRSPEAARRFEPFGVRRSRMCRNPCGWYDRRSAVAVSGVSRNPPVHGCRDSPLQI